jgi:hypothetical protein
MILRFENGSNSSTGVSGSVVELVVVVVGVAAVVAPPRTVVIAARKRSPFNGAFQPVVDYHRWCAEGRLVVDEVVWDISPFFITRF